MGFLIYFSYVFSNGGWDFRQPGRKVPATLQNPCKIPAKYPQNQKTVKNRLDRNVSHLARGLPDRFLSIASLWAAGFYHQNTFENKKSSKFSPQ